MKYGYSIKPVKQTRSVCGALWFAGAYCGILVGVYTLHAMETSTGGSFSLFLPLSLSLNTHTHTRTLVPPSTLLFLEEEDLGVSGNSVDEQKSRSALNFCASPQVSAET